MEHITRNKKQKSLPANRRGFTLIELVVTTAVFSLVIGTAIGLLTASLNLQRKSIAIQNIQDNGRHLMNLMAKEIRMSEIRNSSDGQTTVLVIDPPDIAPEIVGKNFTYTFTNSPNWQVTRTAYILKKQTGGGEQWQWDTSSISSDDVEVDGKFVVDGRSGGDKEQPKVTIVMKVRTTGLKAEQTEISLQTTLSQRNLE